MTTRKNPLFAVLAVVGIGCLAVPASAQPTATSAPADEAINTTCPISGKAIDGQTFLTYEGKTVGLCCGGCEAPFNAWDNSRKNQFVLASFKQRGTADQDDKKQTKANDEPKGDLYTLATCPISGKSLGSMGDAIVKQYDGREVRFCCAGCIGKFEADKKAGFKKIDEQLVRAQLHYYPFDTCIISGNPLVEDGEDISVNYVYKNRLVRLCCTGCIKKFNKDAAAYLKKIDAAIVTKQREHYPLETCVVAKGPLGSMDEPVEMIAGNRLVRFCCAGCKPKFKKNPAQYLAVIDAAWKAKHAEAARDTQDTKQ
jgi:YHS domain-containing protein